MAPSRPPDYGRRSENGTELPQVGRLRRRPAQQVAGQLFGEPRRDDPPAGALQLDQVSGRPPVQPGEGQRLEHLQALRPVGTLMAAAPPGHVDVLQLIEAQAGEGEAGVVLPDARSHLDVAQSGLLQDLPGRRRRAGLTRLHPTAGQLPPLPIPGRERVTGPDQQHAVLLVEHDGPGRLAAYCHPTRYWPLIETSSMASVRPEADDGSRSRSAPMATTPLSMR